ASAAREEVEQSRVRAAAPGGVKLAGIANAHELEIVVLMKRDRIVRPAAGVDAARIDVEPEARVGIDAAVQVRDTDHHMVDAGQHGPLPPSCPGMGLRTTPHYRPAATPFALHVAAAVESRASALERSQIWPTRSRARRSRTSSRAAHLSR